MCKIENRLKILRLRDPELAEKTFPSYAGSLAHELQLSLAKRLVFSTHLKASVDRADTSCDDLSLEAAIHTMFLNALHFKRDLSLRPRETVIFWPEKGDSFHNDTMEAYNADAPTGFARVEKTLLPGVKGSPRMVTGWETSEYKVFCKAVVIVGHYINSVIRIVS